MDKKEDKENSHMYFEIQFFEAILNELPDFDEVLIALGDLYTKKGLYEKGLEIDQKLSRLKPRDPVVFYNLACSYSLIHDIDKSLETIKRAIQYGYDDFDYLESDGDLHNLRQDDRFKQFFSKVKHKMITDI